MMASASANLFCSSLACSFAMMASAPANFLLASANFLFCSSLAYRVFSAAALPAATRFGFFTIVTETFEVTC